MELDHPPGMVVGQTGGEKVESVTAADTKRLLVGFWVVRLHVYCELCKAEGVT